MRPRDAPAIRTDGPLFALQAADAAHTADAVDAPRSAHAADAPCAADAVDAYPAVNAADASRRALSARGSVRAARCTGACGAAGTRDAARQEIPEQADGQDFTGDVGFAPAEPAASVARNAVAVVTLLAGIQAAVAADIDAAPGNAQIPRTVVVVDADVAGGVAAETRLALLADGTGGSRSAETVARAFLIARNARVAHLARIQGAVAAQVGARAIAALPALALVVRRAGNADVLDAEIGTAFGVMRALLVFLE